ncbi:MAG: FHA domain-containing protein [Actinobacteria bacterium]|nr:FHA domain-containing protein [Actinomycetota bacterium]
MEEAAGPELTLHVADRGVAVQAGQVASVGRDPSCTVMIDHPLVSRRHGTFECRDGAWIYRDEQSSNGTYVGESRVIEAAVNGHVELRLGDPAMGPAVRAAVAVPVEALPPERAPAPASAPPGAGKLSAIYTVADRVRIGRDPDNDVVVGDDVLVSRHHAEMARLPDIGYEIADLGSHNGTFVNGRRVRRAILQPLDVVGIGRHRFRVVDDRLEDYVEEGDVAYEAHRLTVRTPAGQVLLDDVSLALGGCSFLAVVGPSGAGKSTLLGALTGFRPAQEGRVVYGGQDLYGEYEDLGQRIGFVPQDDILHPELTVRRALEFAAELRFAPDVTTPEREARVVEVLGELGLTHRADVQISRLSGGQRKRVSVALELLTRPSLLFLDEPTSGLDPGIERNVMELLRSLADGGRTVIVVTHTVQSLRLCDRVLVLAPGGSVAYFGPPQFAPAYFGVDDYEEVFQLLGGESDVDWKARFREHADHAEYVEAPLAKAASVPLAAAGQRADVAPVGVKRGSWGRQLSTLVRRYAAVIAADRRTAALLILQGPFLGALMLTTLPPGQLALPAVGEIPIVSRSSLVLFNLIVGATYLGAANAIREIVKELPILRRERAVGVSLSAYVTSKALLLGILTAAQAMVFTVVTTARQDGPADALVLGSPLLELAVVVALTGVAAMALGLLISALAPTVDRAMTLLPVVLILQLTLASGGLFPELVDKPVLKQATYAAGPQWGFTAAAATVDLNRLQPLNTASQEIPAIDVKEPEKIIDGIAAAKVGDPLLAHEARRWWTAVLALVALSAAGLVAASIALRRHDPGTQT